MPPGSAGQSLLERKAPSRTATTRVMTTPKPGCPGVVGESVAAGLLDSVPVGSTVRVGNGPNSVVVGVAVAFASVHASGWKCFASVVIAATIRGAGWLNWWTGSVNTCPSWTAVVPLNAAVVGTAGSSAFRMIQSGSWSTTTSALMGWYHEMSRRWRCCSRPRSGFSH